MNNVPAYFEGALSFRLGDLDPHRRVKQWLLRLWNAYWDRQARRATAVMLHVLSDRTLADIYGCHPGSREAAIRDPLSSEPGGTMDPGSRFAWPG